MANITGADLDDREILELVDMHIRRSALVVADHCMEDGLNRIESYADWTPEEVTLVRDGICKHLDRALELLYMFNEKPSARSGGDGDGEG